MFDIMCLIASIQLNIDEVSFSSADVGLDIIVWEMSMTNRNWLVKWLNPIFI